MAFSVYAIAPPEEGSEPHDRWVIHHFGDSARYVVHPGGVLGIEVEDTNFWLLSPDRWQWVRSDNHPPGRVVGQRHSETSGARPRTGRRPARVARSAGHRVKHDSRMLDRPPRPVGAVNVLILAAQLFALIPQPPGNVRAVDVIFQEIHGDTSWDGNIASK